MSDQPEKPAKKTYRRPDPLSKELIPALTGRPGVYHPSYPQLAGRLALIGLTDEEIAKVFGISVETLYQWSREYPEFSEARARGGTPADGEVAIRLYHRAVGYDHEAVKIFYPAGASAPVYAKYIEHVPPDVQAGIWWLKNRQKKYWKDETTANVNLTVGLADRLNAALTRTGRVIDADTPAIEHDKPDC